jgi:alanine racemase
MRPIRATIDLGALRHNLGVVRRSAPHSRVLAVVKANAYGHGVERTVRALEAADGCALVELDAAIRLRQAGYERPLVLLEGWFDADELAAIRAHRLTPVIHRMDQVDVLRQLDAERPLDVMLKMNTGMNRLGIAPAEFGKAAAALRALPIVREITLMTHFANADDARGIAWQLAAFDQSAGVLGLPASLANSAAIVRYPEAHRDWVRPGIMLYGCSPFVDGTGAALGLRPVMNLTSEIIAIRDLQRGDTVGYGGAYQALGPTRVGIVACGYADGYPRHAPNGTPIRVGEHLAGTVGRVSMDMLCVDLTARPDARVGTRVVLWGADNPVEHVALAAGTVGYELLCALAPRVPVEEIGA